MDRIQAGSACSLTPAGSLVEWVAFLKSNSPEDSKIMSNRLSSDLKERVLSMPEYRQGSHKVKVILKDGQRYSSVFVAWGSEIVKVGSNTIIPFNAEDIVDVQNDPE